MPAVIEDKPRAAQAVKKVVFYTCRSPNYVLGNIEPEETEMVQMDSGKFKRVIRHRGKVAAFTNFRIEVPEQYVAKMKAARGYGFDFLTAAELRDLMIQWQKDTRAKKETIELRGRIFMDTMIETSKRTNGETDALNESLIMAELDEYGK